MVLVAYYSSTALRQTVACTILYSTCTYSSVGMVRIVLGVCPLQRTGCGQAKARRVALYMDCASTVHIGHAHDCTLKHSGGGGGGGDLE
jgi:hypothetical protein